MMLAFEKIHHTEIVNKNTRRLTEAKEKLQIQVREIEDSDKQIKLEGQFIADISKKLTHTTTKSAATTSQLNPDKWVKMVVFYRKKTRTT